MTTQSAIAKHIGISPTAVSLYINHGVLPKNKDKADQLKQHLTVGLGDANQITSQEKDDEQRSDCRFCGDSHTNKITSKEKEKVMLSNDAKIIFGFKRDPFIDDVNSREDVFLATPQRYIRETLYQTAKFGGFLALVGESGSGKTTLRRDLVEKIRLSDEAISMVMPQTIDKSRLTAAAICDAIIDDISTEAPRRSLEAKARQVQRLLIGSARSGNSHCLVIEEAHDLSIHTLKYLKRFWELEDGFKKLLSIILVGQSELKTKLDIHQNWDAREVIRRIEIAQLAPLDHAIKNYLDLKFKRVGVANPFTDNAYDAMLERLSQSKRGATAVISQAYPLIVNNLAVACLNLAGQMGLPTIDANMVKEV